MVDSQSPPITDDPLEWGPMRAYSGRRSFDIKDPIVEPLWSGTRVLAHVSVASTEGSPVTVRLVEELGADLADELPDVTEALAQGVLALDAIVDGVITSQLTLDGVGAAAIPEVHSRPTEMFVRGSLDFDVQPGGVIKERVRTAERIDGFVAVDLLRVDGTSLLDVPLLERKRLLESVIAPGPLLRLSNHVRPPVRPWVATWKSMGLAGGIMKAANSRYQPSGDTVEWRKVTRLDSRG
jgi:bifunctional non-homologous end joining protein LigD